MIKGRFRGQLPDNVYSLELLEKNLNAKTRVPRLEVNFAMYSIRIALGNN